MPEIIKNAQIETADIVFSRGFILDCIVTFKTEGWHQSYGGFALGGNPFDDSKLADHGAQPNIAADFIGGMMAVANVEEFSKLPGKIVRLKYAQDAFNQPILAVGHPIKDLWYSAKDRFEAFKVAKSD